jgi:IclR family mhp operon transcriptional activator
VVEKEGQIRAIVRALDLLLAMNDRQPCTLSDLHVATGLPKPTIFRILATLKKEGYVRREGSQGLYHLTEKTRRLGAAYNEKLLVVDVGAPLVVKVTKAIKWPLAIGVIDGDSIVVRYSTMPYSPLAVRATTLGRRLGLLDSAMGQAYLAFCEEGERTILLDMVRSVAPEGEMESAEQIQATVDAIRKRGYGLRLPKGNRISGTLAVPILRGRQVPGVLSMTTFGSAMNAKTVSTFLPVLTRTAQDIASAMDAREGGATSR